MKSEPSTDWNPSPLPLARLNPPIIEALLKAAAHQRRRFHVPAHAGENLFSPDAQTIFADPFRYDLTELTGLDVLSEPDGCIAAAQRRAADAFGVADTFFLINGASVGLMAAMLACVKPGEKVLVPRNAHRSVLSGLILTGAEPVWFLPEYLPEWGLWGAVTEEMLEAQLAAHRGIKALFLTSPTYEGIGSDIGAIAAVCRARGIYLIVDEAHGSLWPFSDRLPESACHSACDAVIHSMHKSGGSLTQSALAHLPHGSRIDAETFQQALNTLQTTSPSYLLLASLDTAVAYLSSVEGKDRIEKLLNQVTTLRTELQNELQLLKLYNPPDSTLFDPCKLWIRTPHEDGITWSERMEEEHEIPCESETPYGALYLANLGLEADDFAAFKNALLHEEGRGPGGGNGPRYNLQEAPTIPEMLMTPREAFFAPSETVPPQNAINQIAKDTIVHCPPGIPILLPGERITKTHLPYLPDAGVRIIPES